ncbi:MAG: phosphate/phosphite/phosphonate ABC transporter substrate-binding protein [Rhodospirillales bacterium]|nr:MAG: phosphate/phosphite/phosphonate ABC transporter substrate-binding protein [Rhodospirillales bacterium]
MTSRITRRTALTLIGASAFIRPGRAADDERPVRFGLTAVVVRENLQFFERWRHYLEQRVGRSVRFVQRRSYREIMGLLQTGEIDFAWICGYPYVQRREPEFIDLMAVPTFQGEPLYYSYIIVHRDNPATSLTDLKGKVFAYSDPDSNSGYLVPRYLLSNTGASPDSFFRLTFFTYNHAETVEAIANRVADGGAVDSYVWEFMAKMRPSLTERTKIIARSQKFGFPPLVMRSATDHELKRRMQAAILGMREDIDGRALLAELSLDRFSPPNAALFDGIRTVAQRMNEGKP